MLIIANIFHVCNLLTRGAAILHKSTQQGDSSPYLLNVFAPVPGSSTVISLEQDCFDDGNCMSSFNSSCFEFCG